MASNDPESGNSAETLVDHHVHGVVTEELDRGGFERLINEGGAAAPSGTTHFDSPLGLSIRRHCAPVLGLEPQASPEDYLARRAELGGREVSRRLISSAGLELLLVDTGHRSDEIAGYEEMGELAGAPSAEVVRIEVVAEQVAASCSTTTEYLERLGPFLREAAASAVGLKTVVAYRYGLDLDPTPPSRGEVISALEDWLPGNEDEARPRLSSPVLLAHLLHQALELAAEENLVLQVHSGFGDTDLQLDRADPARFTPWVRVAAEREVSLCFLHCYPYHRQAGYLAAVFPNVYFDVGCILNYAGPSAKQILGEALEMAPFAKLLYSSDAFGLAELVYLGAVQHNLALDAILEEFIARGDCSALDARRIRRAIASENARRIYPLERAGLARPTAGKEKP